jgi:hypothetical protein
MTASGYLGLSVSRNGTSKRKQVAHLVAEAFIGPRPVGLDVCHNDGNRTNNRRSNLRYDTKSENSRDALRHGTHRGLQNVGEQHPLAKLSDADVELIRMLRPTLSLRSLSVQFRVSVPTISAICNGHSRKRAASTTGGPRAEGART